MTLNTEETPMVSTEWRQLVSKIDELDKQLMHTTDTFEYEALLMQIEHLEAQLQQVSMI